MKNFFIVLSVLIIPVMLLARDTWEGFSAGFDGGLLYSANSSKFKVINSGTGFEKSLDISTFVTLGVYGRYGLTDRFGFEMGISKPYSSNLSFLLYRYEAMYMFNPYQKNRFYAKLGGLRGEQKDEFFDVAGKFSNVNGLIYTVGAEFGYADMPINISISYINLKFDFNYNPAWTGDRYYDLSGVLIKGSMNIYF